MGQNADEVTGRDPFEAGSRPLDDTTEGVTWGTPVDDIAPQGGTVDYAGYGQSAQGTAAGFGTEDVSGISDYDDTLDDTEDTGPTEVDETLAQIAETRSSMSETIDAIQEKLSPQNLKQQAQDTVREATVGKVQQAVGAVTDKASGVAQTATGTASGVGSSALDMLKQNAVPAALIGAGLGWLIVKQRSSSSGQDSQEYPGYTGPYATPTAGTTGYASSQAGYLGGQTGTPISEDYTYAAGYEESTYDDSSQSTIGGVAGQVQNQAGQVVGQVQSQAGHLAGQAQSQAGQIVGQAQSGAQRAVSGFQQMLQSNPFAAGAIALAAGAAVGLVVPETSKEDQLMGEARDTVASKAQQTVQDTAQKVQSVAQQAVSTAKQEAQNQGLA